MPPAEARSPGRRSNIENAPRRRPITGEPATPTSHIRRAILRTPPPSLASHRPVARVDPAQPAVRTMASYRGLAGWTQACNFGSRYVAIATQPVPRLQICPIVHN